jgi:hypothetical protein
MSRRAERIWDVFVIVGFILVLAISVATICSAVGL